MEEVLCKDCKWYCTAIKDEPFCNHHHIELVQSACFEGERKVKTNADKIREMSDEELTIFLAETSRCSDWCYLYEKCNAKTDRAYSVCLETWYDWLKEEGGDSDV